MAARVARVAGDVPENLFKPADKIVITDEDAEKITDIAKRSTTVAGTTTRLYVQSLPASKLLSKSTRVLAYATAGASTGAIAGAIVGASGGPGAPVTVPTCTLIGAGVGFGVGGVFGALVVHTQTKKEFREWKKAQTAQVLTQFKDSFRDHSALEVCVDPITKEPMSLPAHCNCPGQQHTMEYTTLKAILKTRKICPLDPERRIVTTDDIRLDYRAMGLASLAYMQLLETGVEVAKLSPSLMKGILALSNDLRRHKATVFKMERADIDRQLDLTDDPEKIVMLSERQLVIARLLNPPRK